MGSEPDQADRELESEIRRGRQFSMAEAIGRLAGPGGMKGASPVGGLQQAQGEAERLIRQRIADPKGALTLVLIREVAGSRILLDGRDDPAAALAAFLRQLLDSPERLGEFVRLTDMEWGRIEGERPYFERDGAPPHPDDPYTIAAVRTALDRLLASLAG